MPELEQIDSYQSAYSSGNELIILALAKRQKEQKGGDVALSPGANYASIIFKKSGKIQIEFATGSKGSANSGGHSERHVLMNAIEKAFAAPYNWFEKKNISLNTGNESSFIQYKEELSKIEISLFTERSPCDECKSFLDQVLSDHHKISYTIEYENGQSASMTQELKKELQDVKTELEENPISTAIKRKDAPKELSSASTSTTTTSSETIKKPKSNTPSTVPSTTTTTTITADPIIKPIIDTPKIKPVSQLRRVGLSRPTTSTLVTARSPSFTPGTTTTTTTTTTSDPTSLTPAAAPTTTPQTVSQIQSLEAANQNLDRQKKQFELEKPPSRPIAQPGIAKGMTPQFQLTHSTIATTIQTTLVLAGNTTITPVATSTTSTITATTPTTVSM